MLFQYRLPKVARVGRDVEKCAKPPRDILNGRAEAGCCHAASGDRSTAGAGEPRGKDLRWASARGTASTGRGAGRRWQKMPGPSDNEFRVLPAERQAVLAVTWPLNRCILGAGPHESLVNRSNRIVPRLPAAAACSPKGYLQPAGALCVIRCKLIARQ